jgi:hypothetical protein
LINLDSFLRQFCQEKRFAVMVQVKGEDFFLEPTCGWMVMRVVVSPAQ